MVYEIDLLEYDDLFDNNLVIDCKVLEFKVGVCEELVIIDVMGGVVEVIEYMKGCLVELNGKCIGNIEIGDIVVVGVNCWDKGEVLLFILGEDVIMVVDFVVE